jgi:hypothetical protein
MANSQIAFLARDQVPDRQRLQEAVKQLRFKLAIDEAYVPFECSGYLPCTLDGEDAGCDLRFGDASACAVDAAHLQAQLGGRDTAMIFRWSGDLRERASAMILCAALAQQFGARVLRPGEDAVCAADRLLEDARILCVQLQEG